MGLSNKPVTLCTDGNNCSDLKLVFESSKIQIVEGANTLWSYNLTSLTREVVEYSNNNIMLGPNETKTINLPDNNFILMYINPALSSGIWYATNTFSWEFYKNITWDLLELTFRELNEINQAWRPIGGINLTETHDNSYTYIKFRNTTDQTVSVGLTTMNTNKYKVNENC